MGVSEHLGHFGGLPVEDFDPARGIADPTGRVYRVSQLEWGGTGLGERLAAFLSDPRVGEVPALVVGCWSYEGGSSAEAVAALVAARDRLTSLRSLFLGDIVYEEQEISWIHQSDLSGLFPAFPRLEELWVRGGMDLRLGVVRHANLRALAVESGGLPAEVVRDIAQSDLPALEHLELWLGVDEYGGNATLADLQPILSGERFPKLASLALRDCVWADELAAAVVTAPVLRRLRVLDLSLGTLSDAGGQALLQLPAYAQLERVAVRHHYLSDGMVAQLRKLPFAVDARDPQGADEEPEDRYVAHAE